MAERAIEHARKARDPSIKSGFEELAGDWTALAEQAEWIDSHKSPIGRKLKR